jgi:invasion protein IalB
MQVAIRFDLIEREGDAAARMQIFVPTGLYLQPGIKLTVDRGTPVQVPYVIVSQMPAWREILPTQASYATLSRGRGWL